MCRNLMEARDEIKWFIQTHLHVQPGSLGLQSKETVQFELDNGGFDQEFVEV